MSRNHGKYVRSSISKDHLQTLAIRSQVEVAALLGTTRQYVAVIEARALKKLAKGLRGYL